MASQIQLSDRDERALCEVGELGLASTDMIHRRHYEPGESGLKYCQRRLRAFGETGWLESLSFTLQENNDGKRRPRKLPSVHRLTLDGAKMIEARTGRQPKRPARSDPPSPQNVLHRLGVVRTRLAISDAFATAQLLEPAWIMERDQYPDALPDAPFHKRFILYEAYGHGAERITCRPDASVWLRLPGDPPWNLILYLEYDRSTEKHSQILVSKVPGYATLLHPKNRFYRQHWPEIGALGRDFSRVAFVCQSEERINNLSKSMQGSPGAENIRFITDAELDDPELLTAPLWRTVSGERKSMIHPFPSPE